MSEVTQTHKSILEMASGAFMELTDREMAVVLENIMDPNTKATAKRKITVTLELIPDDSRQNIAVKFGCNSKLAPVNPVVTWLFASDETHAMELVPAQVPGQMDMDGQERTQPPMLRLIANY